MSTRKLNWVYDARNNAYTAYTDKGYLVCGLDAATGAWSLTLRGTVRGHFATAADAMQAGEENAIVGLLRRFLEVAQTRPLTNIVIIALDTNTDDMLVDRVDIDKSNTAIAAVNHMLTRARMSARSVLFKSARSVLLKSVPDDEG